MQTVCGETGIARPDVVYERSNTWMAPDSGTTSGSRQTLFTGEACIRACKGLKEALQEKPLQSLRARSFTESIWARRTLWGRTCPTR